MNNQLTPGEVRAWREEIGLNQEQFGEMLDQSRATIGRWESAGGAVPGWVGLARDGWKARRGTGIEAQIRKIVREEVQAVLSEQESAVFVLRQRYTSRRNPKLTATVLNVLDRGQTADVETRDANGTVIETQRVSFSNFIAEWRPHVAMASEVPTRWRVGQIFLAYGDPNKRARILKVNGDPESPETRVEIQIEDPSGQQPTLAKVSDLGVFLKFWRPLES